MLEARGNVWELECDALCILTNRIVISDHLIMGAGVAKEAAERYPALPELWGEQTLKHRGHVFFTWVDNGHATSNNTDLLIAFPTKNHYKDPSPPGLVLESSVELMQLVDKLSLKRVLLPRPGCGKGGLNWESEVRPLIAPVLDDRVVVVTY